MPWQPNAAMIPRDLLEDFLDGTMSPSTFAFKVRATFHEGSIVPADVDATTGEIYEPEFDHVTWILSELKDRFPKSRTPDAAILDTVWGLAGQSKSVIEDLITNLEDYGNRAVINSVGGLMKSSLTQAGGDFRSLQADAARIREQRAADPVSFVDDVVRKTAATVKALPPKTGPNVQGVKRLKALTDRGGGVLKAL